MSAQIGNAQRDIVIIGGGHNGLVTAFYLAKAGYKPLVLERRAQVGGAAVTDEFHPGFRCSTLAHTAGPILPEHRPRHATGEARTAADHAGGLRDRAFARWARAFALSGRGQVGAGDRGFLAEGRGEVS